MLQHLRIATIAAFAAVSVSATAVAAAPCGNDGAGFNAWKAAFAAEAAAQGVGQQGLAALANATYSTRTIAADRNQGSVAPGNTLENFISKRLGSLDSFAGQMRQRYNANPGFYQSLEQSYGVPAGILLAIHGMETGFGRFMGNENVVSSILTVAYDCRRADFFTPHAVAALVMVDRGYLDPATQGAAHGELGHTQFLPGNALRYGVDANGDGQVDFYNLADSMASTANFLRQKGWQPGQPFNDGTANFAVLDDWNSSTVYQQAIALSAARL